MKAKYISPNKKFALGVTGLSLLAGTCFTSVASAQGVPNLFAGDNDNSENPNANQIEPTPVHHARAVASTQTQGEKIIFDVYAVGRYFGTALVEFTDEWVEILRPIDVVSQMPEVKDPNAFIPLFSGKIYASEPRVVPGVGRISVDPLNFKMDIAFAQEQALASEQTRPQLAKSSANNVSFSSRMRLTGSTNFDPSDNDSFGFTHDLNLSRGEWSAFASGNYVKAEGYDFANASIEHTLGSNVYALGMLRTSGTNFVAGETFYGMRVDNNRRGIGGLDIYNATPVDVFIPSRSQVRIYRNNNQLIYSREHDFGLQTIDTTRFPSGSYELRIEITENSGTVTEEYRFFNKNTSLTPREYPEYSLALGLQRDELDLLEKPVFEFSYSSRVTDNLQLSTILTGMDDGFVIEPKVKGFFGNAYEYDFAFSYTSEGDAAFSTSMMYNPLDKKDNRLTWFVRYQDVITGHTYEAADITDKFDFINNISRKRSNFSGTITYRFDDVNWSFSGQRSKTMGEKATYSYGPNLTWRLIQKGGHQLLAKAHVTKTRTNTNNGVFLNYRYKPSFSRWDYRASVGQANNASGDYQQLSQDLTYSNKDAGSYGTSFYASQDARLIDDENVHSTNLGLTHEAQHVGLSFKYQNLDGSDIESNETLDYALDSNFIATQDDIFNPEKRSFALVPSQGGAKSNVIVELKGNASGERMAILLNNTPRAYAYVGEKVALNIPEYSGAKLSIQPAEESSGLLDFNDDFVEVHLYPGNVIQQEWVINKMFLVSGRAIGVDGTPLAWQRIEGIRNYATTDSQGYFQIEMLGNETPYINTKEAQCVLGLPTLKKEDAFNEVGDIICG